jgi:hypothetical protein
MLEHIRSIGIALVVLLILTVVFQSINNNIANSESTPTPPVDAADAQVAAPTSVALEVRDQPLAAGNTVLVTRALTRVPGWISIHVDANGSPSRANIAFIAVKQGTTTNLKVPLKNTSTITKPMWALLHIDAGTIGSFEFPGADSLVKGPTNRLIRVTFQLTR